MCPENPVPVVESTSVSVYFRDDVVTLLLGDALEAARTLDDQSVDCIVTSPPYFGLRRYLDAVKFREDLTPDQRAYVLAELDRLGVKPIGGTE